MGFGNPQQLLMKMQREAARIEEELKATRLEGTAGGGVVKASVTGKGVVDSITIDPSAVDPSDVEMLQDLVVAAVNEALRAAKELEQSKMMALTGGLRLPGM